MTATDLVIEELAASEAALREQVASLLDLAADLALQNAALRALAEQQLAGRIAAEAALRRRRRRC